MKKFLVVLAVFVSSLCFGQLKIYGRPLYQPHQEFLQTYNLGSYMPSWDRYIINDSTLLSNVDPSDRKQYIKRYNQFCKWNSDSSYMNIPDTANIISGKEFMYNTKLHLLPDDNRIYSLFYFSTDSEYTRVIGYKTFPVYRDNIKQITIVEYYEVLGFDNITLSYELIIEYTDNTVKLFN